MNDVIKLLPDSVANQIAAGEVIQRPASVVKELVENSVDAGATNIEIIIRDAGRTLIQVVDNGCGMSDTDARMSFERHATSKITAASDLFSLQTMGFRGEALASIAAVAQVELKTMTRDSAIGTRLVISGTRVESQEPCACTPGSNMMVKNLFYTVPARRKFLKKDSVEFANIAREFERLALVNPSVNFTLIHNDSVIHQIRKGSVKQRICDLFGKNLDRQLIPVETDTSIVRISGFIGLPANARKRNQLQYLLINGRNMRHPAFHKAVMECYEELIPRDEQPNYFIYFTVAPETIDVNIHPTKNEIKFENEFAIRQILTAAIRESLGKFSAMPGIDFNQADAPEIPVFNPDAAASHAIELDTSYNPFTATEAPLPDKPTGEIERDLSKIDRGARPRPLRATAWEKEEDTDTRESVSAAVNQDWDKLYEEFTRRKGQKTDPGTPSVEIPLPSAAAPEPQAPDLGLTDSPAGGDETTFPIDPAKSSAIQILNRFILTPCRSGVMVIDQHRAHVRILYDRYVDLMGRETVSTQALIFPEVLRLNAPQNALLESMTADVARLGFDLSPLGDNVWNISGVPAVVGNHNPAGILQRMLEETETVGDTAVNGETVVSKSALAMARAVAIRNGTPLKQQEIDSLLADLMKLPTPNYTPDGRAVLSIISRDEIVSKFTR
ncbi:MAG: DNA mismatch repair endonuclease MutL [Clostridium sp.]|nr:DNA mismatch repair endonuclease MutL [Clostridium sp.]